MRVIFDRDYFVRGYPQARAERMSPAALHVAWTTAVAMVGDDDSNSFAPFNPDNGELERQTLLYLAMSHLLQMQAMSANNGGLSGRITSASEGSVSVSIEAYKADSLHAQFWAQTNDGSLYWMLTSKYRLGGRLFAHRESHPFG